MTNEFKTLKEIQIDIANGLKPCYVYLLFKPDGIPFYVGKGRKNRISAHEAETRYFLNGKKWRGMNMLKIKTIAKIWDSGNSVNYKIDSWHDDNDSASQREIELVQEYGKRISESGSLTNILDGGDNLTEEDRRLIGERIRQYYIDHPEAREELAARIRQHYIDHPESREAASIRMTQHYIDHPETKERISNVLKNYCAENPEFVQNLQLKKNEWIEANPDEYEVATKKRLEVCRSESHRDKVRGIMQEYFRNNPDELERLKAQGAAYFENNPEAIEQARQNCIKNNSAQNLIDWYKSDDPEIVSARQKKKEASSDCSKRWHQTEEGKAATKRAAIKRNAKFRTDEHRQHMAKKTAEYIKNNPEAYRQGRLKAQQTIILRHQEEQKLRLSIQDKLFESGKITEKLEKVTKRTVQIWQENGYINSSLELL